MAQQTVGDMPVAEFDANTRLVLTGEARVGATGLLVTVEDVIPPREPGEYHHYAVSWPSGSATVDERVLADPKKWDANGGRGGIVLDASRDSTVWLEHDHTGCIVCGTTTRKCGNHRFADPFEECVGCGHTEYP